jgi:hypothetical protein
MCSKSINVGMGFSWMNLVTTTLLEEGVGGRGRRGPNRGAKLFKNGHRIGWKSWKVGRGQPSKDHGARKITRTTQKICCRWFALPSPLPPSPRGPSMHVSKHSNNGYPLACLSAFLLSVWQVRDCACVGKQGIGSGANSDDNKKFQWLP